MAQHAGTRTATSPSPTSAAGRSSTCSPGSTPSAPRTVVDLGCGPGNLTDAARPALAAGPGARARLQPRDDRGGAGRRGGRVRPRRRPRPGARAEPVDVLVSNAALQWVPGHLDLLPGLVAAVAPGGWLAFQVPGNFDEPSHTLRGELAARAPYAEHTARRGDPGRPRRRDVPAEALLRPRLRGGRAGRRPTSTCSPARTRSSPGSAAPARDRPCRPCRTSCAAEFEEEFRAGCARPTRSATAWC